MRNNPITFLSCLGLALAFGCVSPTTALRPAGDGSGASPNASLARSQDLSAGNESALVRNQNAGLGWGGTISTNGFEAPRQPMPVSGHLAAPIGVVNDQSYNAPTQFTNQAAAGYATQMWNSGQVPENRQPTGQPWPPAAQSAGGFRPPPPAGYPGSPQNPGPSSPQTTHPWGPTQQYSTAPAGPFSNQASVPPYQPPANYPSPPNQNLSTGFPSPSSPLGRPSGNVQSGPSASFTSVTPPKLPMSSASSLGDGNWQTTTPPIGQSPPGGIPPRTAQGEFPQAVPTQSNAPPTYGGLPASSQPDITPPIGDGWPQAFGAPQPPGAPGGIVAPSQQFADVLVNVQETQTGRFMVGAAVNSDAGLTGQIVIDEQNFDWRRVPTSWDDLFSGNAFRGGGQRLRIEALPGDEVQRYMVQFSEPYLGGTRISFNLSGYLFDRRYFDWDEQRLGGRAGLGYRITPDLSIAGGIRAERVRVDDARVAVGLVPQLDAVIGEHELYSGNISLTQDTRDIPFAPTQGYYLRLSYDQVFGSFDYGRGEIDWRRYLLVMERPDGSGRHVLGFSNKFSLSGDETPIFENFFAGGHATLRGFEFRGASPELATVTIGGRMMFLGSVEYLFPITADDMLKGVVFCDYGTVEEDTNVDWDDFRVALGAGLRVSIPAMGPAPIALDFAVPVSREGTDDIQNFSFFVGVSR